MNQTQTAHETAHDPPHTRTGKGFVLSPRCWSGSQPKNAASRSRITITQQRQLATGEKGRPKRQTPRVITTADRPRTAHAAPLTTAHAEVA